jgi:glycogen debranching enzyme
MTRVRVAQPVETLHGGGTALSCALDGSIAADALHGLFAADTRVLSTYGITLGGVGLQLLSRTREGHGTANWHFQNLLFRSLSGDVPPGSIFVHLRRRIDGAMHDDLELTSFAERPLRISLVVQIDADFADIFEVKRRHLPPRTGVHRNATRRGAVLEYRRGRFQRGLDVSIDVDDAMPQVVGSRFEFEIELAPARAWSCCIEATPCVDCRPRPFQGDSHGPEGETGAPVTIDGADGLAVPFRRACADLEALTMTDGAATYVAAGAPWFMTLFGRDTLVTALMSGILGAQAAGGALTALAPHQATEPDDWRDAEPGKLPHELRCGELAARNLIPHTPYYGTHDAQALYCLALWNAWRWTGDRTVLDDHIDTACAALTWCDEYGDLDGDGLQEYRTRSREGYYDQSWKDAGDAIVTEDGEVGELPLATVELQGYLYAARLAMAEIFDELGDPGTADDQRGKARVLADLVDARFFDRRDGFYALALDGHKRPLNSAGSNPGHLLWCGLPGADNAESVADRLLRPDLFSGWGLRTLSSAHPGYNPLSYQRGSVWPHDTMIAAAGLFRYGHRERGATLLRGVLDAAGAFEEDRLPELFCGFERGAGPPVPYAEANAPQAWAAAAPILAVQLLLGLVPDAPRRRCFLSPWLPEWLPELHVRGIAVGDGILDIELSGQGPQTTAKTAATNAVDVIIDDPTAPLWGRPLRR